jgi:signal transduction histidine kinase
MPINLTQKIRAGISELTEAGTTGRLNEKQLRKVRFINLLSLTVFLLTFSIGLTFYLLTRSLTILIPAAIEMVLSFLPIMLNRRSKYLAAAMIAFGTQVAAIFYFGTLLGPVLELQTVVYYLLLASFILFDTRKSRVICCVLALLLLITLEGSFYLHLIQPIQLGVTLSILFKTLSFVGLFCLTIVTGYPYIVSHDANFELKTSNNAKSFFIKNISHEIQGKLLGLVKLVNAVKKILPKDVKSQKVGTDLTDACTEFKETVSNLLDYTKIDAGAFEEVNREPVNIRHLLDKVIQGYRHLAMDEKGVKIVLNVSATMPDMILSDQFRLIQVCNNLLSNAVKFTGPNTSIEVSILTNVTTWTLTVQDEGDGISVDKVNAIFDPYVTNRDPQNNPEGIGLGLYITRHIVENLLKGTIIAYNSPPLGATFKISLPLLKAIPKQLGNQYLV